MEKMERIKIKMTKEEEKKEKRLIRFDRSYLMIVWNGMTWNDVIRYDVIRCDALQ